MKDELKKQETRYGDEQCAESLGKFIEECNKCLDDLHNNCEFNTVEFKVEEEENKKNENKLQNACITIGVAAIGIVLASLICKKR